MMTDAQKTLIVAFAEMLVGENSPNYFSLRSGFMADIGLSQSEYENRAVEVSSMINLFGVTAFCQFKEASQSDRNLIYSILTKALEKGENLNNPNALFLYNNALSSCGIKSNHQYKYNMNIQLDSSVNSISRTAAYHLSGTIQTGVFLSQNSNVVIYKNRIEFGRCNNPDLQGASGMIAPNFYIEYGNVVYHFGVNLKCGWLSKQIDYVGTMKPTAPDNVEIFNLIYPRFS